MFFQVFRRQLLTSYHSRLQLAVRLVAVILLAEPELEQHP